MKLTIYALYALVSLIAICGEYDTDSLSAFTLYYAFWFANAVYAATLFNKEVKKTA